MEKLKVRHVVGWREREAQVRTTRLRMRASAAMKAASTRAAEALKKTQSTWRGPKQEPEEQ